MSSISAEIDDAVVLMKARAAEFDDSLRMDGAEYYDLAERADRNLTRAKVTAEWHDFYDSNARGLIRRDLVDTMNLCALALSLLPGDEAS